MPTAQEEVFNTTELLELILLNAEPRDILVGAQRVAKRWKEVIEGSFKIQQALFLQASPSSFTECRYTKNEMVPLSTPVSVDVVEFTQAAWRPQPVWLVENASWRTMQVAAPPITTIHWQVHRLEKDSILGLPRTLADLEFPDGLRMGTLHDLIVGTRGVHYIGWPALKGDPFTCPLDPGPVTKWSDNQVDSAGSNMAIWVFQHINSNTPTAQQKGLDLQKYHGNFRKLEKMEATGDPVRMPWRRSTLLMDNVSAMVTFLHAAQDPLEAWF
ncbi:hypothetical protein F4776DRAFT_673609 [Hypoxylon sp. NC0597]|nr:hypothetical protein F4776DRAFT_673609 [Hypoxylon sp. NC0597]